MLDRSLKKSNIDYPLFKIALLGNSNVGKTSMVKCYEEKGITSTSTPNTIGVDITTAECFLPDGRTLKYLVFDTAGSEKYKSMAYSIIRGTHGILLIYSVTDRESFNTVRRWVDDINQHLDNYVWFLIANKTDVPESQRVVSYNEGEQLAKSFGVMFFETSIYDKRPNHSLSIKEIMIKLGIMMLDNKVRQNSKLSERILESKLNLSDPTSTKEPKPGCRC